MAKKEAPQTTRVDIGGQAVMEGVMMKSPDAVAVAVRRPDGSIVVKRDPYVSPAKKHPWMGLPFIRGSVNMVNMLCMGMKVLQTSSDMCGVTEEEPSKFEIWLSKKLGKGVDKVVMGLAVVMALCLSVGLFVLLPNVPAGWLRGMGLSPVVINLISGVIRIAILIAYMVLCGRIPDMRRVFQYHGAEHKTVYCHEHNQPLTPENAQVYTTLHPRCGTSFLLITFVLSILFYTVIDYIVLGITGYDLASNFPLRVLSRLVLLPIVTGLSYESLKGLAHSETKVARVLRWPGMMMQKLTTRQPDLTMLEVAIVSMNAALNGLPEGEKTPEGWIRLPKKPETEPTA